MKPALKNLVITGAGGMIGRAIPFGIKLTRAQLDVTSEAAVKTVLDPLKPRGILHLAAADIRQCQANPQLGMQTNVLGTYHLAKYARAKKIPLIFLSSAAIFNGPQGKTFDEDAKPQPLNTYALTKYLSEILLQDMLEKHLIIRTSWVFGGHGAHHKKFVDIAIEKAKSGAPISVSHDQDGSPTYVADLVAEIGRQIEAGATGIVHIANKGAATAEDIAREIVRFFKSSSKVEIMTALQIQNAVKDRSSSEALVSKRVSLRPWQEALREYCALSANNPSSS